ncbi:hypothetical protein O3P69_004364 [Scylla paramamosain]|uniref:Uncharacterized protein n=1 Tax=Scylla paramamosain TaxID=85552 RepID=A0AAW0UH75_SCYPA
MPDNIRLILADDEFTHPRQLAARADVLWQAKQQDETSITNITTVTQRYVRTTSTRPESCQPIPTRNGQRHPLREERSTLDSCQRKQHQDIRHTHHPTLNFNTRRFKWTFTIADVSRPLLGADFLRAHSLLVIQRHLNQLTFATPCNQRLISTLSCSNNVYAKILMDYPDIVKPQFHLAVPKHDAMDHITTTGPTQHARARKLPPDELSQAEEEFRKMEEMGIVADGRGRENNARLTRQSEGLIRLGRQSHYFPGSLFVTSVGGFSRSPCPSRRLFRYPQGSRTTRRCRLDALCSCPIHASTAQLEGNTRVT